MIRKLTNKAFGNTVKEITFVKYFFPSYNKIYIYFTKVDFYYNI